MICKGPDHDKAIHSVTTVKIIKREQERAM